MRLFSKVERRSAKLDGPYDVLLSAMLQGTLVTEQMARAVPALYAGVNYISSLVATLPVCMYSVTDGKTKPKDDPRLRLINDDTGDLLDGYQFKTAIVEDYLINGRGYAFVNWDRNSVKSIHYIHSECVSAAKNSDPIFKTATYYIGGKSIEDHKLIRMLKDTKDGVSGNGIVGTCNACLSIAYDLLKYESVLARTGGNKKGFLRSANRLTDQAMETIKEAWATMWASPECKAMVLNDGISFQEATGTSVEQQLDERKKTNYAEISKLLNLPTSVLDGTASESVFRQTVKVAITPIITAFETALNRALLLEKEKGKFYFAFDMGELLRGDLKTRFEAWAIAAQNGFMQPDEIRQREELPPLGFGLLRLGLQDVYYNPETKEIYTPNTGKIVKIE